MFPSHLSTINTKFLISDFSYYMDWYGYLSLKTFQSNWNQNIEFSADFQIVRDKILLHTTRLSVTSAVVKQYLHRSRMATKLGRVALRCLKAPSFAPAAAAPARPISTSFVGFPLPLSYLTIGNKNYYKNLTSMCLLLYSSVLLISSMLNLIKRDSSENKIEIILWLTDCALYHCY